MASETRQLPQQAPAFRIRIAWLTALIGVFALFLAIGSVRVYLGLEGRPNRRVWTVWKDLAGDLSSVGSSGLLRFGYVLVLLAFVIGSGTAIWLAMSAPATENETAETPDFEPIHRAVDDQ